MSLVEDYVRDLSKHSISISGDTYAKNFVQVVKDDGTGADITVEHSFYSIDGSGTVKKLGGLVFTESGGEVSLGFNVTDTLGNSTSILDIGSEGLTISGGIDVTGGSTNFSTASIEVSDLDIILGSETTDLAGINGGGVVLGGALNLDAISLIYDTANATWDSNTSINVESGHSFTVNDGSVILGETGLTIDDIVLNSTGLAIGTDVSITSTDITLGTIDPVVLNALGLSVGSNLSLTTTNGLEAGDITLNSTKGLVIGTELTLDSTGLFVGTDIELSVANGLALSETSALTISSTTGDVVTNEEGLYVGADISLTKTGGISFGIDPETVVMSETGLYVNNSVGAIYMGDESWKISIDETTGNMLFQFLDVATYVTKLELRTS